MILDFLHKKGVGVAKTDQIRYTKPMEIRGESNDIGEPIWLWRIPKGKKAGNIVDEYTKGAKKYRRFWAHPSTDLVDFDGTVVETKAVKDAWKEYIQYGNIRLMHQPIATAKVFKQDYEEKDGVPYVGVNIPAHKTETLEDIDTGLISALSIGFRADWDAIEYDDNDIPHFTIIKLAEISLVDNPSALGTDFQEERNVDDDSLYKKFKEFLKLNKSKEEEDIDMTKDEIQKLVADTVTSVLEAKATSDAEAEAEAKRVADKEVADKAKAAEKAKGTTDADTGLLDGLKSMLDEKLTPITDRLTEIERASTPAETLTPESDSIFKEALEALDAEETDEDKMSIPFAGGLITDKVLGRVKSAGYYQIKGKVQ